MFNFVKRLFKKSNPLKVTNKDVKIGSYYKLANSDDNPFKKETVKVLVKDIKNGYVLYAINPEIGSRVFQNESMKLNMFSDIYEFWYEDESFKSKEQIFIENICEEFGVDETKLKHMNFSFNEVLNAFNEGCRN